MHIDWPSIRSGHADTLDGIVAELSGWMTPLKPAHQVEYFLLTADGGRRTRPAVPVAHPLIRSRALRFTPLRQFDCKTARSPCADASSALSTILRDGTIG